MNNEAKILHSCRAVMDRAEQVQVDTQAVRQVASWMAFEELAWPRYWSSLTPSGNFEEVADFLFLTATMNFAFTDFETRQIFRSEYEGREYADSDAMILCWKRAHEKGKPILDGNYLAAMTRVELGEIFQGNMPVPMLDTRVKILREVGSQLGASCDGRFHRWLKAAPRKLYQEDGEGFLEQLTGLFPSFDDKAIYQGQPVRFWKRAQLLCWQLQVRFDETGFFCLQDPERLTFLADYILPMALNLHGILKYSSRLRERISRGELLQAGGEAEVEIRAATIWAGHLLTSQINRLRPPDRQVIEPVVDARFWTHFHNTHHPHHLTRTIAY